MKHLGRWLVCLGLLLNALAFIAFIALGWVNTKFFLVALACYPISLLFIFLARKSINKACTFYYTAKWSDKWERRQDSTKAILLKTLFMPIVAALALFTFALLEITYQRTRIAIEDRFGFSISSIARTIIGFAAYSVGIIIIVLILILTIDIHRDSSTSTNLGGYFWVFGGIVWLASHILWDILDFAEKESPIFILIKNIVFLSIGALSVPLSILLFIEHLSTEVEFSTMVITFGAMIAPLGMHMAYYGVIKTKRPPQSRMTFLWGPIALGIITVYSILVGAIAQFGRAWTMVFYILTIIAYGVIIFFFKMPFEYRDGSDRLQYRKWTDREGIIRVAMCDYDDDDEDDDDAPSYQSNTPRASDDYKLYDIALTVSKNKPNIYISSIAQVDSAWYSIDQATKSGIIYTLHGTLNVDFRGVKPEVQNISMNAIKRDYNAKFNKECNNLINKTRQKLKSAGLDSGVRINVKDSIKINIRT